MSYTTSQTALVTQKLDSHSQMHKLLIAVSKWELHALTLLLTLGKCGLLLFFVCPSCWAGRRWWWWWGVSEGVPAFTTTTAVGLGRDGSQRRKAEGKEKRDESLCSWGSIFPHVSFKLFEEFGARCSKLQRNAGNLIFHFKLYNTPSQIPAGEEENVSFPQGCRDGKYELINQISHHVAVKNDWCSSREKPHRCHLFSTEKCVQKTHCCCIFLCPQPW